MADVIKPIELKLGGDVFHLVFDFEAIAEAEDLLDRPLLTGLTARQLNSPSINFARGLFWAALRRHQPQIDYPAAAKLVTRDNLRVIWAAVVAAWAAEIQEEKDSGGEDRRNPAVAQD